MSYKVSVIIPNYNGEELLQKNLPAVLSAMENKSNNIIEVIVVDDASTDKSVELLKSDYPEAKVIKHKVNRRFSAAVNTGARASKGNLICLLNSDVSPSINFLETVLPHFKDPDVFGVSLTEIGHSWAKGYFEKGYILHKPGNKSNKTHASFWVSGGSGVFRRSMWMKLKGMDEILFPPFYWEDIDLSYRALKRGWKILWEPKAVVEHEHESTNKIFKPKYKSRVEERNQLLFIWKNLTSRRLFGKHLSGVFSRTIRHPGYMRIVLMALAKLPSIMRLRSVERKESKISDESILAKF